MASPDALLKALAAAVALGFGAVMLLARPRRSSTLFLAGFLLLIAGNQGVETYRAFFPASGRDELLSRAAGIFAALDPALLLAFAASFRPATRSRLVTALLAGALACAGALALFAGWASPELFRTVVFGRLLTLYTVVVYTGVLFWAIRWSRREHQRSEWRYLVPALSVVTIPVWPQIAEVALATLAGVQTFVIASIQLASYAALILVGGYAMVLAARGAPDATVSNVRRSVLIAACLVAFIHLYRFSELLLELGLTRDYPEVEITGQAGAPLRWLAFGALASVAVLRSDTFNLDLRARRIAARTLIALVLSALTLGVVALAAQVPGATEAGLQPLVAAGLAAAIVLSSAFRGVVDRVAARIYGVPMPGDVGAQQEIYLRAVREVAAAGEPLEGHPRLATMRSELGLDASAAGVIERLVESATPTALAPGQLVGGRYRIRQLLGKGGSGRVFLAQDELVQRHVVVKELHADGMGGEEALREARIAGAVAHENVVTLYDVVQRPGGHLLVQEYVPGGTLEELLAKGEEIPPERAWRIVHGLLQGLARVHAAGVVHGDVKPANILLTTDMIPKLGDFGIATVRGGETVRIGLASIFRGTPGFAAPEQAQGERASRRSDVYAVGLLARRLFGDALPPGLAAVVRRALEPDPAMRYTDASEMRAAWEAAALGTRVPVKQKASTDTDGVAVAEDD